ncbi:hypothetical protein EXS70_00795 [Candidatus Peribacteria bacterium]|nr:hypothetical protein [Candidatus Peribacteria bacterium]
MSFLRNAARGLPEGAIFAFLGFSILWKGGKSLEATWLLTGLAVLVTVVAFWSCIRRQQPEARGAPPTLWALLMLFIAGSVLSLAISMTRNYGLDEILRDTGCVLFFLWAVGRAQQCCSPTGSDSTFLARLVTVLSVITIVACAVGVAVYVLQPVNRFVGTFFDFRFTTDYWPNAWAEYLLLTWPLAVVWLRRVRTPLRCLVLGSIIASLLLSYSRGAFLVFVLQGGLWCGFLLLQRYRTNSIVADLRVHGRRWGLLLLGTACVALVLFNGINALRAQYHEVESVSRKATFTASEGASSISERRDFWTQSLRLSLQRPFVGYGPYSFRFVQPRLQTEIFATSDHPHNVLLKLALERGWPTALLYLAILLFILVPVLLRLLRPSVDTAADADSLHAYRLPFFLAVIGVLAHNMIDYNLQFVGIALPFWLLLAGLTPIRTLPRKMHTAIHTCTFFVAVCLLIISLWEGYMLSLSFLGRHAEAAGDYSAALVWYDKASGELYSRDMHMSRAGIYLAQDDLPHASTALDDYARSNREDARLWIMRGNMNFASGDREVAFQDYSLAMTLGKYNYLDALDGALTVLAAESRRDEVRTNKDTYMEIFQKFGDAILHNTHFIALSDNVETYSHTSFLLEQLYPGERTFLRGFTQEVLQHAAEERTRSASRAPGFLW